MVSPIGVSRAVAGSRMRDLGLMLGILAWLLYTRMYFVLHASHIAMPACPFFYLTGHPCPFCGGTRSFAYMWQGDMADAVRLYPLGPLFFAGSILTTAGLASSALTGRRWSINLSSRQWHILAMGVVITISLSWAVKVFVLGN